ncbi:hypothetical protein ACLI09_03680 [Flavobacterium sp. RHBU_24]|uniref:hypothetical protein n=1 Tax=Flavobacterium sp. RHBU_24 TaxID=3391185 RepID=UPI0039852294
MRKSFYIAALGALGLTLASLGTPKNNVTKPLASTSAAYADTLTWKVLAQIDYKKKPTKDYPEGVMFPVINPTLKAKQGRPIVMSGFVIPIDEKSYALSKNVFASCFFCGKAGPESIVGIKLKNNGQKFKTDQYVTLQGTFRYNDTDVEDWIYHIENAVVVKK